MKLWVRETWSPDHAAFYPHWPVVYRADGEPFEHIERNEKGEVYSPEQKAWYPFKWQSPIFMPRWASRITLEITDVRVERLQSITAKDILAEGAVLRAHDSEFGHNPVSAFDGAVYMDLKSLWAAGWNTINGKKHPWNSNPWVWKISFRKLEGGAP